jgi:hypothetical protein
LFQLTNLSQMSVRWKNNVIQHGVVNTHFEIFIVDKRWSHLTSQLSCESQRKSPCYNVLTDWFS